MVKRKSQESIFKAPTIIAYLVKELYKKNPQKQIGKTIIQKLIFILSRRLKLNFDFSLYHYGPYSPEVSAEINFAENLGMINVQWEIENGYFIKPNNNKIQKFENFLSSKEKRLIEEVVNRYGDFKAIELSLIATALYLMDYFNVPKNILAEKVHNLKPEYQLQFIKETLRKAGIEK